MPPDVILFRILLILTISGCYEISVLLKDNIYCKKAVRLYTFFQLQTATYISSLKIIADLFENVDHDGEKKEDLIGF